MKEFAYTVCRGRYINGELNPDRIEAFYVRGKTKKRCIEILNTYGRCNVSYNIMSNYGSLWGNIVERPDFEGEGLWITRDYNSVELIPVWTAE